MWVGPDLISSTHMIHGVPSPQECLDGSFPLRAFQLRWEPTVRVPVGPRAVPPWRQTASWGLLAKRSLAESRGGAAALPRLGHPATPPAPLLSLRNLSTPMRHVAEVIRGQPPVLGRRVD